MYLESSADYKIVIKNDILNRIVEEDDDLRMEAELYAEKTISTYLRKKYDVTAIFAKTGADRDRDVMVHYINIALHLLSSRINPNQIPEIRENAYQAAMSWLKGIANGDISPDLPLLPVEEQINSIVVKSEEKKNFDF